MIYYPYWADKIIYAMIFTWVVSDGKNDCKSENQILIGPWEDTSLGMCTLCGPYDHTMFLTFTFLQTSVALSLTVEMTILMFYLPYSTSE